MGFEYDQNKSAANKRKHGIDFEAAQILWNDLDAVELLVASTEEQRYIVIGMIGQTHWTSVITYRNGSIRLISVRHSRRKEIAIYEKSKSL